MSIAAILSKKGPDVVTASPSETVAAVIATLARHHIGAVPVLDAERRLRGIVSERDVVRALDRHGATALDMTAEMLMTADVSTATPQTTVDAAMAIMTEGRFRHLPIVDQGVMVGLVSIGDIVAAHARKQAEEVESLRAFVTNYA